MFQCIKVLRFEASHQLPHHDGKCARLHGHSWEATIFVEGEELCSVGPKRGMLIDFGDVKGIANRLVEDYLDHHHLNHTLASFGIENPTSEEIARWMFNQLKPHLPQLTQVMVKETCTSAAVYRPSSLQKQYPTTAELLE